jgi:hypothetical protein
MRGGDSGGDEPRCGDGGSKFGGMSTAKVNFLAFMNGFASTVEGVGGNSLQWRLLIS